MAVASRVVLLRPIILKLAVGFNCRLSMVTEVPDEIKKLVPAET